ncbi:hypothetical protein E2562_009526 [Oryza meyeriana var. granulata]|uniref:Uncharacterized protein n=1 Tax=Oryza meyeriana var. granulata TaxID=110450 RepID=A0A6G1F5Z6_9ORYZ|nr:hypothetical protein E2562_009526 [Oryza meyeriana var. granulata]
MSTTAGADPPPVRDAYVRLASIFCLHVALRRAASKPGRRPASIASPCARFVQPHLSIHRASSCDLQSADLQLAFLLYVLPGMSKSYLPNPTLKKLIPLFFR